MSTTPAPVPSTPTYVVRRPHREWSTWDVYDGDTAQLISEWPTAAEARACAARHNLPPAPTGVLTVPCQPGARQHLHDAGAAYAGPAGPLPWQMDRATLDAWCVRVTPEEAEAAVAGLEVVLDEGLVSDPGLVEEYDMLVGALRDALRSIR